MQKTVWPTADAPWGVDVRAIYRTRRYLYPIILVLSSAALAGTAQDIVAEPARADVLFSLTTVALVSLFVIAALAWRLFLAPLQRLAKHFEAVHAGSGVGFVPVADAAIAGAGPVRRVIDAFNAAATAVDRDLGELRLSASVFSNTHEGILIANPEGLIVSVNPMFSRITGFERDEVLGKSPRMLQSGRHDQAFYTQMWKSIATTGSWHGEIWNRRKSGECYPELLTISAVKKGDEITHYVGVFADISGLKKVHEELQIAATLDVLTRLPNRALLGDRLEQAVAHAQRNGQLLAVVFIDLDGFKAVNDREGHFIGDRLIEQVAGRLSAQIRTGDTAARIGGDEFVLLLTDLTDKDQVDSALDRILKEVARPYDLPGGIEARISASIGVTIFPHDRVTGENLIRHADQAMYQAKQQGRNCIRYFDPASDQIQKDHHLQAEALRHALRYDEMHLYYQPKVHLETGEVVGFEALLRWQHPEFGVIAPAHFLEPFRQHDLVVSIGEWVIDAALDQIAEWNEEDGVSVPCISINLAARQLMMPGFASKLRERIDARDGVRGDMIEIEILETDTIYDMTVIQEVIAQCGAAGVKFSLDDFGTGYSELSYARLIPVQTLKIDHTFVREMHADIGARAIVSSIMGIARAFGRTVVAEGVETDDVADELRNMGCQVAQGYLYSRPMPAHEVVPWLRRRAVSRESLDRYISAMSQTHAELCAASTIADEICRVHPAAADTAIEGARQPDWAA